jgi:hypothetical protein
LSDDGACVPVPEYAEREPSTPHLERLPARPESLAAYETPMPGQVATLDAYGTGLFVPAPAGSRVHALGLEGQTLDAHRLDAADDAVVLLHELTRAGASRRYLVEYSGLALEPGAPQRLAPGALLGRVTEASGGLSLRVRQLRASAADLSVPPRELLGDGHSISCDPRNVLRLGSDVISGSGSTAPGDDGSGL